MLYNIVYMKAPMIFFDPNKHQWIAASFFLPCFYCQEMNNKKEKKTLILIDVDEQKRVQSC